jgi:hypothetical protein
MGAEIHAAALPSSFPPEKENNIQNYRYLLPPLCMDSLFSRLLDYSHLCTII